MPNLPTQMYLLKCCLALWYFSKNIPLLTLFSVVASSCFTSTIHGWSSSKATLQSAFWKVNYTKVHWSQNLSPRWAQCNSWQGSLSCLPRTLWIFLLIGLVCRLLVLSLLDSRWIGPVFFNMCLWISTEEYLWSITSSSHGTLSPLSL